MTSANSPTPYRDDLFGPEFATSLFVSEPVHNLVHRMVLEPQGVSFRGHRAPSEANREFLASSDQLVPAHHAQDRPRRSTLDRRYVSRGHRAPRMDSRRLGSSGSTSAPAANRGGSIAFIPVDKKPRPIPRLDKLDSTQLVAALESPSGWQRDTAQRLLLHRRDPGRDRAPAERSSIATKRPKTRVQAIWTLADLGGLDEPSAPGRSRRPSIPACAKP